MLRQLAQASTSLGMLTISIPAINGVRLAATHSGWSSEEAATQLASAAGASTYRQQNKKTWLP